MHPSIEKLLKVQGVDNQIRFLEGAMEARPRELFDDHKKLERAKERVDAAQARLRAARMEVDKGEMEVKRCDAEIEKTNVSLNAAKTNEEFAVLRAKIDKTKEERSDIEGKVLEGLDRVDSLASELKAEEAAYATQEKAYRKKEAEVQEIVDSLRAKLEANQAERETLTGGVDADHLEIYERVMQRHRNAAVSLVREGICQGCHMSVTTNEVQMLKLGQELIRCRNCSRLLYVES